MSCKNVIVEGDLNDDLVYTAKGDFTDRYTTFTGKGRLYDSVALKYQLTGKPATLKGRYRIIISAQDAALAFVDVQKYED